MSSPSPDTATGVVRLHRELDALRRRHSQEQGQWEEERSGLEAELAGCHHGHLTGQRLEHFSLIEEKIREVLAMLRSLNTMNISEALLGRLVLDAVEKAYDPVIGEVAVFRFLSLLYQSTRDHERQAADTMLTQALEAVGEDTLDISDSSCSDSLSMPEGMNTLRPRRPQDRLCKEDKEDVFQIHV